MVVSTLSSSNSADALSLVTNATSEGKIIRNRSNVTTAGVITDDDRSSSSRSEVREEVVNPQVLMKKYGFGSGMRMYERSLAEVREDNIDLYNKIPKPPTKGLFSSLNRTFSTNSKAKSIAMTRTHSNMSQSSKVSTKSSRSNRSTPYDATVGANPDEIHIIGSANSNISTASSSQKQGQTISRSASGVSTKSTEKMVSISQSNSQVNGGSVRGTTSMNSAAVDMVPSQSNVSVTKEIEFGKVPSVVPSRSGEVNAVTKSPSSCSSEGSIHLNPTADIVPSSTSKVGGEEEVPEPQSVPSSKSISHAPSMSRTVSNVSKSISTSLSKAFSMVMSPELSGMEERKVEVTSNNNVEEVDDVCRADSTVGASKSISKDISRAPSSVDANPSAELTSPPVLSQGTNRSFGGRSTKSSKVQVVSTEVSAASILCSAQEIFIEEGKRIGLVPGLEDQPFFPAVMNERQIMCNDVYIEEGKHTGLIPGLEDQPFCPTLMEERSLLCSDNVGFIEEGKKSGLANESGVMEERSLVCSDELYIEEGRKIGIIPGLEDQPFCPSIMEERIIMCTDQVGIREGKQVGYVPGLEDQTCCAAEEAVTDFFTDIEKVGNAGEENLLPFNEIEETKPDVAANKWWFW